MSSLATNKKVYEMDEVKEMLGISRTNAYKFAREKQFPVIKLGRRYLVPKTAFDQWLSDNGNAADLAGVEPQGEREAE